MIEIRYLEYEIMHSHPTLPIADCFETRIKLQYRTVTNLMEFGLRELIWSDWTDVPTVKGE